MHVDNVPALVKALVKRGPEGTRILDLSGVTMGFTRLAINGLTDAGMQPMNRNGLNWMCNGEIYNWAQIAEDYEFDCPSGSDCEVLGAFYEYCMSRGIALDQMLRALDGVFAFVIVDQVRGQVVVARDPYGVRPLFIGTRFTTRLTNVTNSEMNISSRLLNTVFASEMKAMIPFCTTINVFHPGTYQVHDLATGTLKYAKRYHEVPWLKQPLLSNINSGTEFATLAIRSALEAAVDKRMMTERPTAALLSGGLDSSLIAALVAKRLRAAGAPPLQTFSIGMAGSSDLLHARKVADWIGSQHHEIVMTAEEFFAAIPYVIADIESYDTTTVRASVGNWLIAREVRRRSDCKVVFNGDGADEVWGSYLYFLKAPSDIEFEAETQRLLDDMHMFDVLRSDRCISSHGLEPRTPFLDKQFVATAMSVATKWRRPIKGVRPEKWLMRKAFDDGTLPSEVLWRRKEAFSDGVSGDKSWYEVAQEKAAALVGDDWTDRADRSYTHLKPTTAEQMYYRFMFESNFGKSHSSVTVPYFWMPRWSTATDPSARTLDVY
jgi:asparagine synthase (glutamine-hydrolysing)